jgi:hypothetical protein
LADHPETILSAESPLSCTIQTPGGRQTEAWFFEQTEAGKSILATRQAVKASGVPHPVWFYLAPGHR